MKHERALAYAAFAIVCVVWGTTYLAIRIAVETIPPFLLTAIRFVIAGLIMTAVASWRGERVPRDLRTLANLALIGFLMITVEPVVVWAEQWSERTGMLFVASAPFWMPSSNVPPHRRRVICERVGHAARIRRRGHARDSCAAGGA